MIAAAGKRLRSPGEPGGQHQYLEKAPIILWILESDVDSRAFIIRYSVQIFASHALVGNLLLPIPITLTLFRASICDLGEDGQFASVGVRVIDRYDRRTRESAYVGSGGESKIPCTFVRFLEIDVSLRLFESVC